MPKNVPTAVAISIAGRPRRTTDTQVPNIVQLSTSLPRMSVPNQC